MKLYSEAQERELRAPSQASLDPGPCAITGANSSTPRFLFRPLPAATRHKRVFVLSQMTGFLRPPALAVVRSPVSRSPPLKAIAP